MEKFWIEFNEIFKQHGDAAARSGKRISFGTHHIRRGYLRRDFHLLRSGGLLRLEHGQVVRERRFKLGSPYNLKAKHIRALIDDWLARRHSRSYLENKLSVWRQFCAWINKPNLVPGTAEIMSYPNYRHRSQVAVIDKTWSGRGIDVPGKLREIASSDARVALVLELMLMFSLPSENWWRLGVWLAIGLLIYFLYGRKHSVMTIHLEREIASHGAGGAYTSKPE